MLGVNSALRHVDASLGPSPLIEKGHEEGMLVKQQAVGAEEDRGQREEEEEACVERSGGEGKAPLAQVQRGVIWG